MLATGVECHRELSMWVLEHGVNIEVEEPICVEVNRTEKVLAKASGQGARVAARHRFRLEGLLRAVLEYHPTDELQPVKTALLGDVDRNLRHPRESYLAFEALEMAPKRAVGEVYTPQRAVFPPGFEL